MKILLYIPFFAFIFISSLVFSQGKEKKGIFAGLPEELTISAYVDAYISYDNDKGNPIRQFSSIAPYRDEFRLNLVMAAFRYSAKNIRGNLAIQFGDIPKLNWQGIRISTIHTGR
jgi:hypothetical protein